jgi:hypothetical protein
MHPPLPYVPQLQAASGHSSHIEMLLEKLLKCTWYYVLLNQPETPAAAALCVPQLQGRTKALFFAAISAAMRCILCLTSAKSRCRCCCCVPQLQGRTKSLFSTLKKLLRLGETARGGRSRAEIYDLVGVRAVVLPRRDMPAAEAEEAAAQVRCAVHPAVLSYALLGCASQCYVATRGGSAAGNCRPVLGIGAGKGCLGGWLRVPGWNHQLESWAGLAGMRGGASQARACLARNLSSSCDLAIEGMPEPCSGWQHSFVHQSPFIIHQAPGCRLALQACYLVREAVHSLWETVPGRCKDYIAGAAAWPSAWRSSAWGAGLQSTR